MHEGQVIGGRYQLVRKLGAGGMGEVWLAHDNRLNRDVAVKGVLIENADLRVRLKREGETLASIDHPGIVRIFDSIVEGKDTFLVMQYIPGFDLAKTRQQTPSIPDEVKVRILSEVLAALAYLHDEVEVLQRDLKPSNVLLDAKGKVYLADFGIARALGRTQTALSGKIRGSLPYMAPEVQAGRAASAASDVWSFGAVALWLFTGRTPMEGIPDHDFAGPYTPSIRAALDERRPSAYDLLNAFLNPQAKQDSAGSTRTATQTTTRAAAPQPAPPAKKKKRSQAIWVLVSAAVVVLLAAVALLPQFFRAPTTTSAAQDTTVVNSQEATAPSPTPTVPSATPSPSPSATPSPTAAPIPSSIAVTLDDAVIINSCARPGNSGSPWKTTAPQIARAPYPSGFSCKVSHRISSGDVQFLVPVSAKRFTVVAGQVDESRNTTMVERFEVIDTVTGAVLATADLPYSQSIPFDISVAGVSRLSLRATLMSTDQDPYDVSGEVAWAEPRFVS